MPIDIISQKMVYLGRAFNIRKDHVRLPNGKAHQIDIVEHRNAVTILPVGKSGTIWFIRQYRHPAEEYLLELPAGVMEAQEEPEISAQRELREEIGMAASQLHRIGGFFLAPGYSTEFMYVFLATGLLPDPLPGDDSEFLSIEKIPVAEAFSLALSGQIKDAKTLGALFLATTHFRSMGLSLPLFS